MDEQKSTIDKFMEQTEKSKSKINAIAEALKQTASSPKTGETVLADGTVQRVYKSAGPNGKSIFTVTKNDKNTMTFSTKKQLTDYLGE
jgi:hypothetical protein